MLHKLLCSFQVKYFLHWTVIFSIFFAFICGFWCPKESKTISNAYHRKSIIHIQRFWVSNCRYRPSSLYIIILSRELATTEQQIYNSLWKTSDLYDLITNEVLIIPALSILTELTNIPHDLMFPWAQLGGQDIDAQPFPFPTHGVFFKLKWRRICYRRWAMEAQEHWMIPLQRVYYPTLAAVGIPCEYLLCYSFVHRAYMRKY